MSKESTTDSKPGRLTITPSVKGARGLKKIQAEIGGSASHCANAALIFLADYLELRKRGTVHIRTDDGTEIEIRFIGI